MQSGTKFIKYFLSSRTFMIIFHAGKTVCLNFFSMDSRRMSINMFLGKKLQLICHSLFAFTALQKAHCLAKSEHPCVIHIFHHIRGKEFTAAVGLHIRCWNCGRYHEKYIYQKFCGTFQEIIHSLCSADIHNFMRISNDRCCACLCKNLCKFSRRCHTGFNMHMCINKSRHQISASAVDFFFSLVFTNTYDCVTTDCNIRL